MGTSLYIKAIFDFRLDYLIQNLNFEVRLENGSFIRLDILHVFFKKYVLQGRLNVS